jgi:hypothetical protein
VYLSAGKRLEGLGEPTTAAATSTRYPFATKKKEISKGQSRLTRKLRIYDHGRTCPSEIYPGKLPPALDPHLDVPNNLPRIMTLALQHRYDKTPIYEGLMYAVNIPESI